MPTLYDAEHFLLSGDTARRLYQDYAVDQPICDYHCHLSPQAIYEDQPFDNIGQVWLGGDHYKWRAMRLNGCDERLVTGDATDEEKFIAFAGVCEKLCGSPVHHWAQMELHTYFDIDLPLNSQTAKEIYDRCGKIIRERGYSPRTMIERSNVKLLATTDDPVSDLCWHKKLMEDDSFSCRVLPTFRPDPALKILEANYATWLETLGACAGMAVDGYDALVKALAIRLDYFAELGTCISDQVIEYPGYAVYDRAAADAVMAKRLGGEPLTAAEIAVYFWTLLEDLCKLYREKGFVAQLHIGAFRNVNSRMRAITGVDSGFDIMWDEPIVGPITRFFDRLNQQDALPRVILYSLNQKDNEVLAAAAASFPEAGICGKVQLGSAWWHNDHKEGIYNQLTTIAQQNLLAPFVGMLTDSRSFFSYARHDYFRRILCSFIADRIDRAEYIASEESVAALIRGVCFDNAAALFQK